MRQDVKPVEGQPGQGGCDWRAGEESQKVKVVCCDLKRKMKFFWRKEK